MHMASAVKPTSSDLRYMHFQVAGVVQQSVCIRCQKTVGYAATDAQLRVAETAHTASCEDHSCRDCTPQREGR